jgi:phytoene dehydrogenase-like protein
VTLLEKSAAPGGRATTRNRDGYLFNLGPHALYRGGHLRQTLKGVGVDVHGGVPTGNGGFALYRGRLHTLPVGLTSLLTTGLLGLGGKVELARWQSRLLAVSTAPLQRETLASWLHDNVRDEGVRHVLEMLVRVTTFTHDPDRQSAGAAIDQLQLSLKRSVLYLDGGWQTIVDGIRMAAERAGARLVTGAPAIALERKGPRDVEIVRLADGTAVRASAVIVAAGPADVDTLTGTRLASTLPPPIRVATLDLALRSLPRPKATVAFGIDRPVYFSVHSSIARLAPDGGAVIHVSRYLRPNETAGREVEEELETLTDMMQPGWRTHLVSKQYLPSLTVTHTSLTAAGGGAAGRPAAQLEAFDNVFIAGDWVGPSGQLSDGSAASAEAAANLAVEAVRTATMKASATSIGVASPARPFVAGLERVS